MVETTLHHGGTEKISGQKRIPRQRTARNDRGRGLVGSPRSFARKERTLSVRIPAGVDDGARIRLAGEGDAGARGGPRGDLYIFLSVKPHELFERDGLDLHCGVPVPMFVLATA